jgi:hypothetical protein
MLDNIPSLPPPAHHLRRTSARPWLAAAELGRSGARAARAVRGRWRRGRRSPHEGMRVHGKRRWGKREGELGLGVGSKDCGWLHESWRSERWARKKMFRKTNRISGSGKCRDESGEHFTFYESGLVSFAGPKINLGFLLLKLLWNNSECFRTFLFQSC